MLFAKRQLQTTVEEYKNTLKNYWEVSNQISPFAGIKQRFAFVANSVFM